MTPLGVAAARVVLDALARSPLADDGGVRRWIDARPGVLTAGDPLLDVTLPQPPPAAAGSAAARRARRVDAVSEPDGPTAARHPRWSPGVRLVSSGSDEPQIPPRPARRGSGGPAAPTLPSGGRVAAGSAAAATMERIGLLAQGLLRGVRNRHQQRPESSRPVPPQPAPWMDSRNGPAPAAQDPFPTAASHTASVGTGDLVRRRPTARLPSTEALDVTAGAAAEADTSERRASSTWSRPAAGLLGALTKDSHPETSPRGRGGAPSFTDASSPSIPGTGARMIQSPRPGPGSGMEFPADRTDVDVDVLVDVVTATLAEQARRHGVELP